MHRHKIAPIDEVLSLIPIGSSVLDIGCGGGLLLNCAAALGRISAGRGFDVSESAISVAVNAADALQSIAHSCRPYFEVRSVEAGLPEGQFDVVCLVDVLHHIPRVHQISALDSALSRVRPGGLLIVKEMMSRPAWHSIMNRLHDLLMARQWISYLDEGRLKAWASHRALTIDSERHARMLWYSHQLHAYRRPHDLPP